MTRSRMIYGVGINDAEYKVCKGITKDGKWVLTWMCPFYKAWKEMMRRCYSGRFHQDNPSYHGCSVCEDWIYFSNFRGWMESQDWEGNDLDKDLIKKGNKIYSPETCVFISKKLNNFVTNCVSSKNNLPLGVYYFSRDGNFASQCRNPFTGNSEHLGYFSTPDEAHLAWKSRKNEHANMYASMQNDKRVAEALIARFA